eukprot:CAMPEP_0182561336 /NCGR_PEP_ID=MMETSP1324-20130603/3833_1 /TAXON_ID=236786 /ORGANISM="Florenciella sp., Strain RCC1587" /LENGTH=122 /DNA_ID=CAMNT_0024773923 /DNA_START=144 /DNA_END=509 /DNA_ORIENTATION=+
MAEPDKTVKIEELVTQLVDGTIPTTVKTVDDYGAEVQLTIEDALLGAVQPGTNTELLPSTLAHNLAMAVALGDVGLGVAVNTASIGVSEVDPVSQSLAAEEQNPDVYISPLLDRVAEVNVAD